MHEHYQPHPTPSYETFLAKHKAVLNLSLAEIHGKLREDLLALTETKATRQNRMRSHYTLPAGLSPVEKVEHLLHAKDALSPEILQTELTSLLMILALQEEFHSAYAISLAVQDPVLKAAALHHMDVYISDYLGAAPLQRAVSTEEADSQHFPALR